MKKAERKALRTLLDYMSHEKDDFDAVTAEGDAAVGHIYHDMRTLDAYLQRTETAGRLTTGQKEMLVVFGFLALVFVVATIFVLSGGTKLLNF
jgi:hypothetical protein